MTETRIKICNLNKNIGKNKIIKDFSLEVMSGEVFGFLGPNGAGKTTVIRMICGLYKVSSGKIAINGYDVTTDFEKAINSLGAIIEFPSLYPHLTGFQNLKQVARIYDHINQDRIEEVIKFVKLENSIHKKFKTYSLGMKQRLGIAQALLHNPSVLILDEPMNGLDPLGIKELRSLLRELAENNNVTVFVSSHILSEMEQLCDRVGIIQDGTLLEVCDLRDLDKEELSLEDKFLELTKNHQSY